MFNWFKTKFKILELPDSLPLVPDDKALVSSLKDHPGFRYLTTDLRLKRVALEENLKHGRHKDLSEVQFLQAGIFWARWLEHYVEVLSKAPKPPLRDTTPEEETQLKEILSNYVIVGS